jgi:hypothetical protein
MGRRVAGRALAGALFAVLLAGCDVELPEEGAVVAAEAVAENPLLSVERPHASEKRFGGLVKEALPAGGYTYLRIACDDAVDRWVVTMTRQIEQGARVDVRNMGVRRDFRSKRLDRTFDEVVFGIVRRQTVGKQGADR